MKILRAGVDQMGQAQLLLDEYYEAIGVVKRDSPEEIQGYLADAGAGGSGLSGVSGLSGLWIAYVEEAPAGCVVLRPLLMAAAGECKRLYVRPEFRGMGLAGGLMDALEGYAAGAGLEWVYLDSKDDLREALRIYTLRGYEACERYNDNPQATVFLRKRLGCGGRAGGDERGQ